MNHEGMPEWTPYQPTVVTHEGTTYFLVRLDRGEKRLVVQGDAAAFQGETSEKGVDQ